MRRTNPRQSFHQLGFIMSALAVAACAPSPVVSDRSDRGERLLAVRRANLPPPDVDVLLGDVLVLSAVAETADPFEQDVEVPLHRGTGVARVPDGDKVFGGHG